MVFFWHFTFSNKSHFKVVFFSSENREQKNKLKAFHRRRNFNEIPSGKPCGHCVAFIRYYIWHFCGAQIKLSNAINWAFRNQDMFTVFSFVHRSSPCSCIREEIPAHCSEFCFSLKTYLSIMLFMNVGVSRSEREHLQHKMKLNNLYMYTGKGAVEFYFIYEPTASNIIKSIKTWRKIKFSAFISHPFIARLSIYGAFRDFLNEFVKLESRAQKRTLKLSRMRHHIHFLVEHGLCCRNTLDGACYLHTSLVLKWISVHVRCV